MVVLKARIIILPKPISFISNHFLKILIFIRGQQFFSLLLILLGFLNLCFNRRCNETGAKFHIDFAVIGFRHV